MNKCQGVSSKKLLCSPYKCMGIVTAAASELDAASWTHQTPSDPSNTTLTANVAEEAQHCAPPCQLLHGHRLAADIQHLQLRPAGPCTHSTPVSVHDMEGTPGCYSSVLWLTRETDCPGRTIPATAASRVPECILLLGVGCRPVQLQADTALRRGARVQSSPVLWTTAWLPRPNYITGIPVVRVVWHFAGSLPNASSPPCRVHSSQSKVSKQLTCRPPTYRGDHAFERKYAACSKPW